MWPSYVINLTANIARLTAVQRILDAQKIPFERLSAINGWRLTDSKIAAVYDAKRNRRDGRQPLIPAEIGCYLSHIEAWKRIAEGDAKGGFVFEDDFASTDALGPVMSALSEDQGGDWDMVKLFTLAPTVPLGMPRELLPGITLGIPYRVPTCLIGYGLTKKAAAHLASRAVPFFRPVDEDQKFVWETGLRVALVRPAPVLLGDQQTITGTIGSARREEKPIGVRHALHSLSYAIRYRIALARHRRAEGWSQ